MSSTVSSSARNGDRYSAEQRQATIPAVMSRRSDSCRAGFGPAWRWRHQDRRGTPRSCPGRWCKSVALYAAPGGYADLRYGRNPRLPTGFGSGIEIDRHVRREVSIGDRTMRRGYSGLGARLKSTLRRRAQVHPSVNLSPIGPAVVAPVGQESTAAASRSAFSRSHSANSSAVSPQLGGSLRYSFSSGVLSRPSTALRCGKRPKRRIASRCRPDS